MSERSQTSFLQLHPSRLSAKASPSDVRRNNRSLIFRLLFPNHPCSRAELGRLTGLSRVAVSDVVNDMLKEGLVREMGYETDMVGKGKRGTLLGPDTTRLHIIAIDLSQSQLIQGAVTNLLGVPIMRSEMTLNANDRLGYDTVTALIERLLKETDHVIGIAIGIPGVIHNGVIFQSTVLDCKDFDLRTPLEKRFGVSVCVTNDVTCSMMTERYFGGQAGPNLLFVKVDRGIGASTLIDDRPVIGVNNASGEIGHISIDSDGPPCPCGKRGCLEQLISSDILRKEMQGASASEKVDILAKAGARFASVLAMSIGLLDLNDICVYGPPDIVNNAFLDAAQDYLNTTTTSAFHKCTAVRRCQCGADVTLRGATIEVVRHYVEG